MVAVSDIDYAPLARFHQQYIPFPPFVAALAAIEENLRLFRETGIAQHLIVLGETGTGKSALCEWIRARHPRRDLPDGDMVEALIGAVPPSATVNAMVDVLLKGLGDPYPDRSTLALKSHRVAVMARGCHVELLVFDEAQHFYDRGDARTHYMVADWLKHLIDEIAVPTVLVGLPRVEQLLQGNEQLRRRFSRRFKLALGQSETDSIETECLQLFVSLTRCMDVEVRSDPYDWLEMGTRLYFASDGRVGYIKKILAAALRHALENQAETIDAGILESIFRKEIWSEGRGRLNPFNEKFDFRRLDRGGEPFEAGHVGRRRSSK